MDYKDAQTLRRFMSPHAKILNHNRTGTCPKHQRMVTKALKAGQAYGIACHLLPPKSLTKIKVQIDELLHQQFYLILINFGNFT